MAKQQGKGGGGGGAGDKDKPTNHVAVALGALAVGLGAGVIVGLGVGGAPLAVLAAGIVVGGVIIAGGAAAIAGGLGLFGTPTGCFVQGTQVLMADMTLKPIETIAVNDMVLSRHEKTGELTGRRVSEVFAHDVNSTLNLTLLSGEIIGTTDAHRFALSTNGFAAASSIGVGAQLCTDRSNMELLRRESVRERARVYNFTVEEFNTYFVGQARVWVHNLKKGDPGEPPEPDGDP
jgi:Pretoxin HINT domain